MGWGWGVAAPQVRVGEQVAGVHGGAIIALSGWCVKPVWGVGIDGDVAGLVSRSLRIISSTRDEGDPTPVAPAQRRINGSHSRTGVALAVGVAVALAVAVGVDVLVAVAVAVGVGLGVAVAVAVGVAVGVAVAVAVAVGVGVAVAVGLAVGVDVRVGVGCPEPLATTSVYSLITVFGW